MIETTTLPNGMRLVCQHRPSRVVYCGLAVDAGTRDELDTESGMAHLIEHMSFKGTRHRRAIHIINRMEAVGGELNAYTSKEHTIYYCSTLRQHLRRALDLLFDITLQSTYPQHELDHEREVVIDEIESYNDSPSELIYDDFEALLFPRHPLGRNILGQADALRQYQTADLQRFVSRLYHPSRMVLFVLGDVTMKQVVKATPSPIPEIQTHATAIWDETRVAKDRAPYPQEEIGDRMVVRAKGTHQSHVVIGTRAYPMGDPRHTGLYLLNNLLGGPGMNSRLNLALRERRGLVYTVESSLTGYTDTGVWTTYFGCDHTDVARCCRLVEQELRRLTDAPLSASALASAKRQLKGQLALSWEQGENVAIGMGRRMLHLGNTQTLADLYETIDSLTSQQLWDIAGEIFVPDRLLTLRYS